MYILDWLSQISGELGKRRGVEEGEEGGRGKNGSQSVKVLLHQ